MEAIEQVDTSNLESAEDWPKCIGTMYDAEGKKIADALFAHLPGGTVDALIRHLLLGRASLFCVPFVDRKHE